MKRVFKLTIDIPPGVDPADFADYMVDAVQTMRGGYNPPRDDLNSIDMDTMTVSCRHEKGTYLVSVSDLDEWKGIER